MKMPEQDVWGAFVVGGGPRDADFIKSEAETPLLISYRLNFGKHLLSLRFMANRITQTLDTIGGLKTPW